jgi:hypothetical protein
VSDDFPLPDAGAASSPPAPEIPDLWRTVCALGVAQIVSWGTLFYTIAVLGAAMRTGSAWATSCCSAASPRDSSSRAWSRRWWGGRSIGTEAAASSRPARSPAPRLRGARHHQGPLTMLAGWLLAGIAMAACLYDPAFATLHQIAGGRYRRAVTALTLFGGFASTVFCRCPSTCSTR